MPALVNTKKIILHHNNARSPLVTLGELGELDWENLSYPKYSSDLTPSDFDMVLSVQNF